MSGIMNFTHTVIKNLFHKPVTLNYPEEERTYPERTRGRVHMDINQCVLCSLCARQCPTGAITVDRKGQTWSIDRFGCIQCRSCVDHCPKKCLSMETNYTQPGPEKVTDTYQKPAAEKPEAAAKPAEPKQTEAAVRTNTENH